MTYAHYSKATYDIEYKFPHGKRKNRKKKKNGGKIKNK
jgi:hypothetical protein